MYAICMMGGQLVCYVTILIGVLGCTNVFYGPYADNLPAGWSVTGWLILWTCITLVAWGVYFYNFLALY